MRVRGEPGPDLEASPTSGRVLLCPGVSSRWRLTSWNFRPAEPRVSLSMGRGSSLAHFGETSGT